MRHRALALPGPAAVDLAMTEWRFIKFGLIVTGETAEQCLPSLFRILAVGGTCFFEVIRRIGQRSPILSERRRRTMVGTGKAIPDRDAEQIGFPARRYLAESDANFVLLVDDLEADRRAHTSKRCSVGIGSHWMRSYPLDWCPGLRFISS